MSSVQENISNEKDVKKITHTFKESWRDVFLASWLKYPTPERPDILSVDIIDKNFDPESGTLKAKRLIILKNSVPGWIQWFIPSLSGTSYFIEESVVDVKEKSFVLRTTNVSYSNIMEVEEVCTYHPHRLIPIWTQFCQTYKVDIYKAFGIKDRIESFLCDTADKNAKKGRKIMNNAIEVVKNEYNILKKEYLVYTKELSDDITRMKENLLTSSNEYIDDFMGISRQYTDYVLDMIDLKTESNNSFIGPFNIDLIDKMK